MNDGELVNPLLVLGFLSIFHLIGGMAIGLGWRQWADAWRAKGLRTPPFLLLWGVLLGVLPLLFALVTRDWAVLAGQGAVLLVGWALAFWLARPLSQAVSRRFAIFIALGVILMVVGSLVAVLTMNASPEQFWQRLAFGGLFFALGSLILAAGLAQWLRPGRRQEAPAPTPPAPAPAPTPVLPPISTPLPVAPSPVPPSATEEPVEPPVETPPAAPPHA